MGATRSFLPRQKVWRSSGETAAVRSGWRSATYLLIIINALVFYALAIHNIRLTGIETFLKTLYVPFDPQQLRHWGGDYGPDTRGGQYWRVITSQFLHNSYSHLAINMLFLWGFGRQVERLIGNARTVATYLLAGVGSSVLGLCWHPAAIIVGSSGAVAGIVGALIPLVVFARVEVPRRKTILLCAILAATLNLVSGLHSQRVDVAGHVGGLMSGLALGAFFSGSLQSTARERLVHGARC